MQLRQLLQQSLRHGQSFQLQTLAKFSSAGVEVGSPSSLFEHPALVACILERLPVLMPPAPDWHVQRMRWETEEYIKMGHFKEYPRAPNESTGTSYENLKEFNPVPSVTKHDKSGNLRTMKRQLYEKLFLLVNYGTDGKDDWKFPQIVLREGESLRAAGQRALNTVMGQRYPIYYIGNGPIGHFQVLQDGARKGLVFYMNAQVVDEPWDVQLVAESGASDHVWVAKSEVPKFVPDIRYQELFSRLL